MLSPLLSPAYAGLSIVSKTAPHRTGTYSGLCIKVLAVSMRRDTKIFMSKILPLTS